MIGRAATLARRPSSLAVIIAAAVIALIALSYAGSSGRAHDVRLVLVGPRVVSVSLAERAGALPGHPFDASGTDRRGAALSGLSTGSVDAVVIVDLTSTRDALSLAPGTSPALAEAVTRDLRVVERSYGRSLDLSSEQGKSSGSSAPVSLPWLACLVALVFVAVISMLRGPFARTLRHAVLRLLGLAVAGATLAAITLALPTGPAGHTDVAMLTFTTVFATGVAALALEALGGLAGLVVAVALLLSTPTVALQLGDPALAAGPLRLLAPWTPGGAGGAAIRSLSLDQVAARPILVLGAWLIVGLGVLACARVASIRQRARGVVAAPGAPPADPRWRRHVALAMIPTVGALAIVAIVVPGPAPAPRQAVSLASHTKCVYTGDVHDVADLNRVTRIVRGSSAFEGGDVGESVALEDGRRLWLFGDTLRSASYDGQRLVRNSMLVVRPGCLEVVVPDDGGAVIPDRADGIGYWPMAAVAVHRPGYDLVSVATQRIRSTGTGVFDFADLGPSIAVFVVPRGGVPQLVVQRDLGRDDADPTRPIWGAAAAVDGGWLYLYGTSRSRGEALGGFSLRVARVRPLQVLDRTAWRYWDGHRWSRRAATAAPLIPASGGVSQTLSVFHRGRTWYAFSKRDEVLGHDLVFWTAPRPTGPFTARPPVGQLPSDGADGTLRYMPLAHPDLFPRRGSIVISYSRNSTDLDRVLKNPLLYRPRFLRVRLP